MQPGAAYLIFVLAVPQQFVEQFWSEEQQLVHTHMPDSHVYRAYLWAALLVFVFVVRCKVNQNV